MEKLSESCRSRNHGTLYHRERRQAFRLGCNRWTCIHCGPRKANRARDRLRRVNWQKLITVTLPPGRGWPKPANLRYQSAHLRSFWRALTRRYGAFRYAWVREVGPPRPDCVCHPDIREINGERADALDCICGAGGNRLHLHILIDVARWIDKRWLQAMAIRCGFGWVDIRAIRGELVSYVVKYLAKGWAMPFPPRTRRLQTRNVERLEPAAGWAFTWYPIHLCVPIVFDGLYCLPGVDYWEDSS
jgi:hypothetical protein